MMKKSLFERVVMGSFIIGLISLAILVALVLLILYPFAVIYSKFALYKAMSKLKKKEAK